MALTKVTFSMIDGMYKTPEDYGATGGADDTAAVQAAFDSGFNVIFTQSYNVTEVTISGTGRTIDFNGHYLVGTNTGASLSAVLNITGVYLQLKSVHVNADFKSYNSGIHWYSTGGSAAQNNTVWGMVVINALYGLTLGPLPTLPSDTASQSENTIYDLVTRSTQVCISSNTVNGFVTLVSPILDCNPFDWASQPGYNVTTFNTDAKIIDCREGVINVIGGELLKTTSGLGYGIYGKGIYLNGTVIESAAGGYATGSVQLIGTSGGYMGQDGISWWTVDVGATGTLTMTDCSMERATAPASGQHIFRVSDSSSAGAGGTDISASYTIVVSDSYFGEWQQWVTMTGTSHFANFNPVVRNMTISNSGTGTTVQVNSNYLSSAYAGGIFSGTGTLTSATATGTVVKNNNLVTAIINYTITTNGTGATSLVFAMPYVPATVGGVSGYSSTGGTFTVSGYAATNSNAYVFKTDGTYPGGDAYGGQVVITYTTTSALV